MTTAARATSMRSHAQRFRVEDESAAIIRIGRKLDRKLPALKAEEVDRTIFAWPSKHGSDSSVRVVTRTRLANI